MSRFFVKFDGELDDTEFDSYEAADEYALYLCSCAELGAETLHMSNPGDYDYDKDDWEDPDYEIVEVD